MKHNKGKSQMQTTVGSIVVWICVGAAAVASSRQAECAMIELACGQSSVKRSVNRPPLLRPQTVLFPLSPVEVSLMRHAAKVHDYTSVALDSTLVAPLDSDSLPEDIWLGVSTAGLDWAHCAVGRAWDHLYVELTSASDLRKCLEGLVNTRSSVGQLWLSCDDLGRLDVIDQELCVEIAKLVRSVVFDFDELTSSVWGSMQALSDAGVADLALRCRRIAPDLKDAAVSDLHVKWVELQHWDTLSGPLLRRMAPEFVRICMIDVHDAEPVLSVLNEIGAAMELGLRSDGTSWPSLAKVDGIVGLTLELGGFPWSGNNDGGWISFVGSLPDMEFLSLKQGGDWGEAHLVQAGIGYKFRRLELEDFGDLKLDQYGCASAGAFTSRLVTVARDAGPDRIRMDPEVISVDLPAFSRAVVPKFLQSRLGASTRIGQFTYGYWDDIYAGIRGGQLALDSLLCSATAMTRTAIEVRLAPALNVHLHDGRSAKGCEWLADLAGATGVSITETEIDVSSLVANMPPSVKSLYLVGCTLRAGTTDLRGKELAVQWLTMAGCSGDVIAFRTLAMGQYGTVDLRRQEKHAAEFAAIDSDGVQVLR